MTTRWRAPAPTPADRLREEAPAARRAAASSVAATTSAPGTWGPAVSLRRRGLVGLRLEGRDELAQRVRLRPIRRPRGVTGAAAEARRAVVEGAPERSDNRALRRRM